jgi:hypothetical protein
MLDADRDLERAVAERPLARARIQPKSATMEVRRRISI